jgi:cytochrome P450
VDRSSSADATRQIANLVGAVAQAVAPALGIGLGLDIGSVSDENRTTIVPADYAFAIWGPIFLLTLAYAAFQALPAQRANPLLRRVGWGTAVAFFCNAAWELLYPARQYVLSEVVFVGIWLGLAVAYRAAVVEAGAATRTECALVALPVGLMLGWITAAKIVGLASALVGLGFDREGGAAELGGAALLLFGGAVVAALTAAGKRGSVAGWLPYAGAVVWALAAGGDRAGLRHPDDGRGGRSADPPARRGSGVRPPARQPRLVGRAGAPRSRERPDTGASGGSVDRPGGSTRMQNGGDVVERDFTKFLVGYFAGDQAVITNPYPAFRQLREHGPVLRVDAGTGAPWDDAWHVFDYATVAALLRDDRMSARRDLGGRRPPAAGSASEHGGPEGGSAGPPIPPMMLTMDPPDHTRLRRLVTAAFTPKVVERLRGDVQQLVDDLLDEAEAGAGGERLRPGPGGGLPAADHRHLPVARVARSGLAGHQALVGAGHLLRRGSALGPQRDRRRRLPGRGRGPPPARTSRRWGLIGALVAARDGGDVLSDAELIGQCQLLLVAGHETASYAIASAVLNLLRTPGAWEGLPDQPIDVAVEELLRYDAPFQTLNRRAAADIEAKGRSIRAGELVWLWLGAANHDPAQFADPDRLDLGRRDNRHLSFGFGIHFCLGAALARLEMRVALASLRARFPGLRLAEEEIAWRDPAIRGPRTLSVARS